MRVTEYQSTPTKTSKVLLELGKRVLERSNQPITQTEWLIKSVIAKMEKVRKIYKSKQGKKDHLAKNRGILLADQRRHVRSLIVQLKHKEVAAMKPVKDIAHENVLENLEPNEKRRKLTESALMALISDKHSIRFDKSSGIYFLKLPVMESGKNYINLSRTGQGAKAKVVGNRALAHV